MSAELNHIVEAIDAALVDLPTSKVIDRFVMNDILLDLKSKVLSFEADPVSEEAAELMVGPLAVIKEDG